MTNVSELFGNAAEFIEKAEQTGEVDLGIIEPLRGLSSAFEQMSAHWLELKHEERLENTFSLYHTARNCKLVLRRMIQRFEESPVIGDNPRVADDASQVLPILIDTFSILEEAKSGPIDQSRVQGFDRVRYLRNMARMVDMVPNEAEDLAAIPIETRKRGYEAFAEYITGAVHDNEGPC